MEIKKDAWDNFCTAFDTESNVSNFKYDFKVMTKKYGQAYMEFCKMQWAANNGVQTEEEFMSMNGNMPKTYFDKISIEPPIEGKNIEQPIEVNGNTGIIFKIIIIVKQIVKCLRG